MSVCTLSSDVAAAISNSRGEKLLRISLDRISNCHLPFRVASNRFHLFLFPSFKFAAQMRAKNMVLKRVAAFFRGFSSVISDGLIEWKMGLHKCIFQ